ncbi:AbrB/MazE/SpoVT family DNA-binding domain-containing protein [Halomonas sp. G15]|uniref:AbrB/MazE/SpoVT family DNA-binding domain-containing protein n=1 Tax=Halomonas sp. G15 TaxID=2903521 RepID=UPI001E2EA338|nr:AbrB/MazE/SpoVT family DNA-binding domain-containing protein [Halomonas sp. G15]MCE0732544.1 AbrB/MazE/SpoVT family DNA-binding domain-containing protein [Halomonas sp. G15]
MRTHLRKIGNSKGVLIPAAMLAELGVSDEVEIHLEGQRLVVEPIKQPRRQWFSGYDASRDDAVWEDLVEVEAGEDEWQW